MSVPPLRLDALHKRFGGLLVTVIEKGHVVWDWHDGRARRGQLYSPAVPTGVSGNPTP